MVIDKKSKAHEAGEVLKHELAFKIDARRNKLLGLWVAEHMGLSGATAEAYAKEVVISDLDEPGDNDVVRKVMKDVADNGLGITEESLRQKMEELLHVARQQIDAESA
jgi:hypothetical protein